MNSPFAQADMISSGDEHHMHIARSPSMLPLHYSGEASSSEESSSGCAPGFFHSPTSTVRSADSYFLPTWSANPQSPGSDRRTSPLTIARARKSSALGTWLAVGFVMLGVASYCTSQLTLNTAASQISVLEQHRLQLDGKLTKYEKDIRELEHEIMAVDKHILKHQSQDARANNVQTSRQRAITEMNELQKRLHAEALQAQTLKKQVQEMSRSEILYKYGSGVHRVEMELVFPDHHRGPTKFIIELAPADVMPHSVHTFLEMVSTGLLDGCSFILNALHVLKAAPLPYDGTSAALKAKAFSEKGLESVSFKEYNEQYPHKKYTVGFAADGSPSFYINTDDNSEIHVGDPCFGKVVSGFDTVQRLEANPTRNGIWFEKRIGIKSARILSP